MGTTLAINAPDLNGSLNKRYRLLLEFQCFRNLVVRVDYGSSQTFTERLTGPWKLEVCHVRIPNARNAVA